MPNLDTAKITVAFDGDLLRLYFDEKLIATRESGKTWTVIDQRYRVSGGEPGNYDQITVLEVTGDPNA